MESNYQVIDLSNWKNKKHFLWFSHYTRSDYGITKKMDITEFLNFIKKEEYPFYLTMILLITKALNEIEEFRYRVKKDSVILYDTISPAFTVMTQDGIFDNAEFDFSSDFQENLKRGKEIIEKRKIHLLNDVSYNDLQRMDYFYFSSIPWISFESVTHPINEDDTKYVPRIEWGKYEEENGKAWMNLQMNVNHSFVDGYPLAMAFLKIQEYLNDPKKIQKV